MENNLEKIRSKFDTSLVLADKHLRFCVAYLTDEIVERFNLKGCMLAFSKRIVKITFVARSAKMANKMMKQRLYKNLIQKIENVAVVINKKVKLFLRVK
mgnify:CR=1 FL=1